MILLKGNKEKVNIKKYAKNPTVKRFLGSIFFLSFLSANLLLIIFFDFFLDIHRLPLIIKGGFEFKDPIYLYYVFGFLLTILFIKTKWIINIFQKTEQTVDSTDSENKIKKSKINLDSIKKFLLNSILLLRIAVFNIFNEAFILIVFWVLYLFILSIFQLIKYPNDYDFSPFFTAVGMIGIISGFFQLYINTYQEKVTSTIEKHLIHFTSKYVQTHINPNDFSSYLEDKDYAYRKLIDKFKKIDAEISKDDIFELINHQKGFRSPLYLQISNTYSNKDTFSKFNNFDIEAENYTDKEKETLNEMYKKYFKHKRDEFVSYIEKHDGFKELNSLLLPSIIFFDEMNVNLYRLNSLLDNPSVSSTNKHKRFSEHYNDFFINCYLELIGIILDSNSTIQPVSNFSQIEQ